MKFTATYLGSSGWIIEFNNLRILVDPWLTGKLVFPPGPWLIEGVLTKELALPQQIDLLLLTQGLADHSHPPSLQLLPKNITVIGSISASKVAKRLGFENVSILKPQESKYVKDIRIEATSGAPVPSLENGYILEHNSGSLYIEPHGFLDMGVKQRPLAAVITPVVNLKLPFAGKFIKGKDVLPELINKFSPLTILSSTVGGYSSFKGVLNNLIKLEGSIEKTQEIIPPEIRFINPEPEKKYSLKNFR
tara:strand:+ start:10476 stop:11219 length:744 start_codon:yes stop_codon:yes gene_type:complete